MPPDTWTTWLLFGAPSVFSSLLWLTPPCLIGRYILPRLPAWAIYTITALIFVGELAIIAVCDLVTQSDAQGAIIWMGGLPLLLWLVATSLMGGVFVWRQLRDWVPAACALACLAVPACYFGSDTVRTMTTSWNRDFYVFRHGKTPWEAGQGLPILPSDGPRRTKHWDTPYPIPASPVPRGGVQAPLEIQVDARGGHGVHQRIRDIPCARLLGERSARSDAAVMVRIQNGTTQALKLDWIDYDGARQPYATIESKHTLEQQTYLTHPWILSRPDGSCLWAFAPR